MICLRYSAQLRMNPYRRSRKGSHRSLLLVHGVTRHAPARLRGSRNMCVCRPMNSCINQGKSGHPTGCKEQMESRTRRHRLTSHESRIQGPDLIEPRKFTEHTEYEDASRVTLRFSSVSGCCQILSRCSVLSNFAHSISLPRWTRRGVVALHNFENVCTPSLQSLCLDYTRYETRLVRFWPIEQVSSVELV